MGVANNAVFQTKAWFLFIVYIYFTKHGRLTFIKNERKSTVFGEILAEWL